MTDLFSNRKVSINIDAIMELVNKAPENSVMEKYDKDHNSIFSREEVIEFLNDIGQFNNEDGDSKSLSEKEALNLYNNIMSKDDKHFKKVKVFENGQNPIIDFLQKINRNFDIKKTLSERFDMIEPETAEKYKQLTDEQFENAKRLMRADTRKNLGSDEIYLFAQCHSDKTNIAIQLIELLNKECGTSKRYSLIELKSLIESGSQNFERIKRLLNIEGREFQLSLLDISKALNISEQELEDVIKRDPNFIIEKLDGNYTGIKTSVDKGTDFIYDNVTHKQVGRILKKETNQLKIKIQEDNNTHTKRIRYESKTNPEDVKIQEFRFDEQGNTISQTEFITGSGPLDICASHTDTNGNKTPMLWTNLDPDTGIRTIQKNFVSPDGTKTEYNYEQTPDGITVSEYKITDRNGNILLNQTRTFTQQDENHFISSLNGKVFETEFSDYKITILNKSTNEKHTIDLTGKIEPEQYSSIISVLKRMPADMLLKMENRRLDKFDDDWDASWSPENHILTMSTFEEEEYSYEALGILMHEFGHFIDTANSDSCDGILSGNEEFVKIYKEEYQNLLKTSSFWERQILDYFTSHTGELGGRLETLAESNLLLTNEYTSQRAFYLQKFFPKTIAKAAELLNNA